MDFIVLIDAASGSDILGSFMKGREIKEILEILGEDELQTAYEIILKLNKEGDPKGAFQRALGHLETAHNTFKRQWTQLHMFSSQLRQNYALKDTWTCCLIALSHKFIGSDESYIGSSLDNAIEAWYNYRSPEMGPSLSGVRGFLSLVNPKEWYRLLIDIFSERNMHISCEDLKEFCLKMGKPVEINDPDDMF